MRGGRRLPWILGGILLLAAAGVGALWGSARAARRTLEADLLVSMGEEARALEAEDPMPPPEENAATLYLQALAVLDRTGLSVLRTLDGEEGFPREGLVALVAANGPALRLAERAAVLDRCRFPSPVPPGPGNPAGVLEFTEGHAALRTFAGILTAEARMDLLAGRPGEAARKAILVTRIDRHRLQRSLEPPSEIETDLRRVADLLERVLRDPALDAATAGKVARELPDWRALYDGETSNARIRRIRRDWEIGLLLSGRIGAGYEDHLRREFRLGPRSPLGVVSNEDLRALRALRAPDSPRYAPATRPFPFAGKLTVIRTAFAVRAFVLEHGRPPPDLARLVPDLLPAVPEDPFEGGPLSYEAAGNGWAVGSRGRVRVGGRAGQGGLVDLDLRIAGGEGR